MIRTDELLAAIDLVALIGDEVQLKRRGRDWTGLCPFHSEKTPSLHVDAKRFKCFGCGKGGDAITFVRELHGLSFVEACERLAQRAGISLEGVRSVMTPEAQQRLQLAESELPAFETWIRLRIEAKASELAALRESYRVRVAMRKCLEDLLRAHSAEAETKALNDEKREVELEQCAAMRDLWFAQDELIERIAATGRRIEADMQSLELEPENEVVKFLRVYYVDESLRKRLATVRPVAE